MREKTALERAIDFACTKVPDAIKANDVELATYKDSVSIKGIRLFAKRGWPILAQVLIGKRWVTVIRGVDPSIGANFGITARGIKARVKKLAKRI